MSEEMLAALSRQVYDHGRELEKLRFQAARQEGQIEQLNLELGRLRGPGPAFTGMDAARAAAGVDEDPPAPGAVHPQDVLDRFGEIHGAGISWEEMERRRGGA